MELKKVITAKINSIRSLFNGNTNNIVGSEETDSSISMTRWEILESGAYFHERDKLTLKEYELFNEETQEGFGFPIRYTDFDVKVRTLSLPKNISLRLWKESEAI